MSFYQKKYLKYKTKYLALKNQLVSVKNTQLGGNNKLNTSANFYNIHNIELLTDTPSMLDVYGYELKGGHHSVAKIANYKKLAQLLSDSEISQHSESETNSSSSSATGSSTQNTTQSAGQDNKSSESEQPSEQPSEQSSEQSSEQPSEQPSEPEQDGGAKETKKTKKTKKQKKHFFEDSDLDSTTTNSDLSTLSTDDISEDSDSDL